MATTRFHPQGADALTDAVIRSGEQLGDVRDHMWAVAYARGFETIKMPVPLPESRVDGLTVFSHAFRSGRTMHLIEAGENLVGIYDWIDLIPPGCRVRAVSLVGQKAEWSLKALQTLGCELQVRFNEPPAARATDVAWVAKLRACLQTVREVEANLRKGLDRERQGLQFVAEPTPFRTEMEDADKALREQILKSEMTDEEKRELARAKTPETMQAFVAARNKRLVDLYRAEVVKFRDEIPRLRLEWDERWAVYAKFHTEIARINETDSESRIVTETTMRLGVELDAIEKAGMSIRAGDLSTLLADPRPRFGEITVTVDLLFELLPKHLQKLAPASM